MHAAAEIDGMALLDAVGFVHVGQGGVDGLDLMDADGGQAAQQDQDRTEPQPEPQPQGRIECRGHGTPSVSRRKAARPAVHEPYRRRCVAAKLVIPYR
ncbi:MAG: hypothetical protein NVV74_06235 [Magnetospirillum sp.]|nr:hypothetical protein [Magnetospirillum sp.]